MIKYLSYVRKKFIEYFILQIELSALLREKSFLCVWSINTAQGWTFFQLKRDF